VAVIIKHVVLRAIFNLVRGESIWCLVFETMFPVMSRVIAVMILRQFDLHQHLQ